MILFLVTALYCSEPKGDDCTEVTVRVAPMKTERAEGWCSSYGPIRVVSDVAFGFAAHRAFVRPETITCVPA